MLNRHDANRYYNLVSQEIFRLKLQAVFANLELPPPTPQEQAIEYIEKHLGFLVDDEGMIHSGKYEVGELEGVDMLGGQVIIKFKWYQAIIMAPYKRKIHEP